MVGYLGEDKIQHTGLLNHGVPQLRKSLCVGTVCNVSVVRGDVYTFGSGRFGQLGHGTRSDEWYPRKIDAFDVEAALGMSLFCFGFFIADIAYINHAHHAQNISQSVISQLVCWRYFGRYKNDVIVEVLISIEYIASLKVDDG